MKIVKKLLVIFFFSINFLFLPAAAADTTIIDTITQQQAQDLKIQVPPNTTPGSHTLLIEVLNSDGSSFSKKEIQFCMDLKGIVHWDNICAGVAPLADTATLAKITDVNKLPDYSPRQEPKKTADKTVVALAVLTTVGAGVREIASSGGKSSGSGERAEKGVLKSIGLKEFENVNRQEHWGDRKGPWRNALTPITDGFFIGLVTRISPYSPLVARTANDGNYLRAFLGSFALPIYVIGILAGALAAASRHFQAMPPKQMVLVILMLIGTIDALAGFLAGSTLFIATLVAGHILTFSNLLTMVGVAALCFAPTLIGIGFRPYRRSVENGDLAWERLTDYFLGPLLTGWTVSHMVGGLNGLGGKQFEIATHTASLLQISMGLIIFRMLMEDAATYFFPMRLRATRAETPEPLGWQLRISIVIQAALFYILARPFVGNSIQLLLGTALFIIPLILKLGLSAKFPKSMKLGAWFPKGTLKILYSVFVGGLLATLNQKFLPNPKDYLLWGFVIFSFHSFALSLGKEFGDKKGRVGWREKKYGRFVYRFGGVVVFILVALLVKGVDLAGELYRFF